MSLNNVQRALEDFSTASEDRAIVFKGAWGTGKTFLWDLVVRQKKEKFAKPKYSYVSLFGINSLSEFKRAIFENSIAQHFAHEAPTLKSLTTNFKVLRSSTNSFAKRIFRFGAEASIPYVKGVGSLIESIQYASVRDITICIDDFERKGSTLTDRDVLGLISNLVEKKRCRVILILNEKTLKPDAEFFSFNEKVFDYEISFKPSVAEAVSLVFKSGSETERKLTHHLKALGMSNIRLLKKVDFFLAILKPYFEKWDVEVTNQALHVLPLAVLAIYGGKETLADIDIITSLEYHQIDLPEANDGKSAEEKAAQIVKNDKVGFLLDYGFRSCDEFDKAIIDLIRQGYADDENLEKISDAMHKKVKYDKDLAVYKTAWAMFRGSFELNDAEVFTSFEHALELTLTNLSVEQLDQVSMVYEAVSQEIVFQRHVEKYFKYAIGKGFLEFDGDGRDPRYPYLVKSLESYQKSLIVHKPLYEIFEKWPDIGSIDDEDVIILSRTSVVEYYNYFKSLRGNEISVMIGKCLRLGALINNSYDLKDAHKHILVSSYEAVLKIASESKLNTQRTLKFVADYDRKYQAAKKLLASPTAPEPDET